MSNLEEIFTGPLTRYGYIEEDELEQQQDSVTISDLIGIIRDIEGVRYVEELWFEDDNGNKLESIEYELTSGFIPYLHLTAHGAEESSAVSELRFAEAQMALKVFKDEREFRIVPSHVRAEFDRLNSEYQALRRVEQNFADVYTPPKGTYRDFAEYHSIQNDFPNTYGINWYGVPESEPPRRRAQAKQLKAYLLFFEQILANFLANLGGTSTLFSLAEDLNQSYFHQLLDNRNVPNVKGLYTSTPNEVNTQIADILSQYDPFSDRRSRALDYLLALYGERFTQNSLRHFNFYYTNRELNDRIVRNKIKFLAHLVELSQRRAGAFNYRRASWNTENVSGLQKKVSILLDLKYAQTRALTDVFVENGLEIVSDDQFSRLAEGTVELQLVDLGDIDERINQPFEEPSLEEPMGEDTRRRFDEIVFLKQNVISEPILKSGIYLDSYRVGSTAAGNAFQLLFTPDNGEHWWFLAAYGTEKAAVHAANDLRRFLIKLNVESEGVHIVEHVLLRPLSRDTHAIHTPEDFYSFRMSVIFPSWTARFSETAFRILAEETVQLNCPAHIHPEFYWLDFKRMHEFEVLYKRWLDLKRADSANHESLDAAAEQLIQFLLTNRGRRQGLEGTNHENRS